MTKHPPRPKCSILAPTQCVSIKSMDDDCVEFYVTSSTIMMNAKAFDSYCLLVLLLLYFAPADAVAIAVVGVRVTVSPSLSMKIALMNCK